MSKTSKKQSGSAGAITMKGLRLKRPREHPEDDLQEAIVTYFAAVVKPGDALLFAVPNGEKRDQVTAERLTGGKRSKYAPDETFLIPAGLGVLPGMTDLIIASAGGVTTFIEVKAQERPETILSPKRAAGKLSRSQKIVRDALIKLGHNHETIYSIEEFDAILRKRGIAVKAMKFPISVGSTVFIPPSNGR